MKLQSKNQEIELRDDTITITKQGVGNALAGGLNGARSIAVRSITSIQMKEGGWMPGYLLFSYAGSKPFRGGLIEATQDPDAFIFPGDLNAAVLRLKEAVEKIMRTPPPTASPPQPSSLGDELQKLDTLRRSGVLTQAEFDSAKKKLLGI